MFSKYQHALRGQIMTNKMWRSEVFGKFLFPNYEEKKARRMAKKNEIFYLFFQKFYSYIPFLGNEAK